MSLVFFHRFNLFLYSQDKVCQKVGVFFFFFFFIILCVPRQAFQFPMVGLCFYNLLHSQSDLLKCQSDHENPLLKILQRFPVALRVQASEHGFQGPVDWASAYLSSQRWLYILVYTCCPIIVINSTLFHSQKFPGQDRNSHGPFKYLALNNYLKNKAT